MGSCRSSPTVMVNTHSPPPAALLVFKMKAVKVRREPVARSVQSIAVGELTVHCLCAALAVVTGVLLCHFSSKIKYWGRQGMNNETSPFQ